MPYVPVGVVGNAQAVRDLRNFANAMDVTATRLQSAATRGGLALDSLSARTARLQGQMVAMGAVAGSPAAAGLMAGTVGGRYSPALVGSAAFAAARQQQIQGMVTGGSPLAGAAIAGSWLERYRAGMMPGGRPMGQGATAGAMTAAAAWITRERNLWRDAAAGRVQRLPAGMPQGISQMGLGSVGYLEDQVVRDAYGREVSRGELQRRGYEMAMGRAATARGGGVGGMGMAGMMAMGGMGGGMGGGGVGRATSGASGLPRVFATMGRTGLRFGTTLTGATLAIAAMTSIVQGITRTYSAFEDEMVGSTAIMRDLSDMMRSQLAGQARVGALRTRFFAPDSAAAEYYLASAGYSPTGVLMGHPVVSTGAQAARMDIPRLAELATDVTRSAGRWVQGNEVATTRNLQKTIDQVLHISRLVDATPEQLFTSLTQLAGIGEATGQPFEQMLGLTGVLANVGQKSSTSRDLGVQLLNRLAQMGSDPKRARVFEQAGIDIFDQDTGDFRSLVDILAQFEGISEGMNDRDFNRFLNTAGFGAKSARPMRLLLGEVAEYRRLLGEMQNAHGAAAEIAAEQLESLGARWDLTKSKIQDSQIALGEAFLPALSDGLGLVDSIAGGIHSWALGVEDASRDLSHYEETLKRIREMDLGPGRHTFPTVEGDLNVVVGPDGIPRVMPRSPDLNRRIGATMGELWSDFAGGATHPAGPIGMVRGLMGLGGGGGVGLEELNRMLPVTAGGAYGGRMPMYGLEVTEEQTALARDLAQAVRGYQRGGRGRWRLLDMMPDPESRERLLSQYSAFHQAAPAGIGGGGNRMSRDLSRYMTEGLPSALSASLSTAISETEIESWAINKFVSEATGQIGDAFQQVYGDQAQQHGEGLSLDVDYAMRWLFHQRGGGEPVEMSPVEAFTEEQMYMMMELQEKIDQTPWGLAGQKISVTVPGYGFHEATGGTGGPGSGEEEEGELAALSAAQEAYMAEVEERLEDMGWNAGAPTTMIDTSYEMVPWTAELQARLDDWNNSLGAEIDAYAELLNREPIVITRNIVAKYAVSEEYPGDDFEGNQEDERTWPSERYGYPWE